MRYLRIVKFKKTESRMVIVRGWEEKRENEELMFNRYRVSAEVNERLLKTDDGDACTTM